MARETGANAFVVLGIVLVVVGALGFVYGQATLQSQDGNGDGDDSLLQVTVSDGDDGGNASRVDYRRVARLGGLLLGIVGAVMTIAGVASG